MAFRRAAKTDDNHSRLRKQAKRLGACWLDTHQLKKCCDAIVTYRGKTHYLEIKDGAKFPKKFWKMPESEKSKYLLKQLTEGEKDFMCEVIACKGSYQIVYDWKSLVKVLGVGAFEKPNQSTDNE